RFGVLAADVDDRARPRKQRDGAARVTTDLGDLLAAEGHAIAAIPGPNDANDIRLDDLRIAVSRPERVLRDSGHARLHVEQRAPHDGLVLVDNHRLGLRRSDVNSRNVFHAALPLSDEPALLARGAPPLWCKVSKNASTRFLICASDQ